MSIQEAIDPMILSDGSVLTLTRAEAGFYSYILSSTAQQPQTLEQNISTYQGRVAAQQEFDFKTFAPGAENVRFIPPIEELRTIMTGMNFADAARFLTTPAGFQKMR